MLGVNWQQYFLHSHPDLHAKYSRTLDQDRLFAENEEIFQHWFDLFLSIKEKHGILDEDIYNMDEKGFMMGGSVKVVISKHEKQAFSAQLGNREWVSSIESICTTGRSLPLFVIFKGVNKHKASYDVLEDIDTEIATSENGWTDNELGLDSLKKCFEPATAKYLHGEYRLLIVDGHASHISTEFSKFCNEKKIILLCLSTSTYYPYVATSGRECFWALITGVQKTIGGRHPIQRLFSGQGGFSEDHSKSKKRSNQHKKRADCMESNRISTIQSVISSSKTH